MVAIGHLLDSPISAEQEKLGCLLLYTTGPAVFLKEFLGTIREKSEGSSRLGNQDMRALPMKTNFEAFWRFVMRFLEEVKGQHAVATDLLLGAGELSNLQNVKESRIEKLVFDQVNLEFLSPRRRMLSIPP